MQSNTIVRCALAMCLVFLLFTTVLSASISSDSKTETNTDEAQSALSESNEDLTKICHHFCSNNQFTKRAYLKGFVHGRSVDGEADSGDDLLEKRFVHG